MANIGVNMWVWTAPINNPQLKLFEKIADMGFDSVEIPLETLASLDPKKVAKKLKETGLTANMCGCFGTDRDFTSDNPAYRKNSKEYLEGAIRFAAEAGAPTVIGPMYSAVGKRRHLKAGERKQEWNMAVEAITAGGRYAAQHGVTLAIEPLNRFETDLINTSEQCCRLVDAIGLPNVGVHLDTFHMNIEERSLYAAIKLAGKRLKHFHACENDRGAPGSGHVQWAEVAKALKEVRYQGPIVIESFTPKCVAMAAAAAIWRTFSPTQDDLAKDGLKYLRKLLK